MRRKTQKLIEMGLKAPWIENRLPPPKKNGKPRDPSIPFSTTRESYYEWFQGTIIELPKPVYCCLFTMGLVSLPERYPWQVLSRGLPDDWPSYVRCYDRTEISITDQKPITRYVHYPPTFVTPDQQQRKDGVIIKEPIRAVPFYMGKWRADMVEHMKAMPAGYAPLAAEYVNYAQTLDLNIRSGHSANSAHYTWGPSFRELILSYSEEDQARYRPSLPYYTLFDSYLEGMIPGARMSTENVPWLEATAFDNPFDLDQEPWELEQGLLRGIAYMKGQGLPYNQESRLVQIWKDHYVDTPREGRRTFDGPYYAKWYRVVSDPAIDRIRDKNDRVSVKIRAVNPGLKETAEDYE